MTPAKQRRLRKAGFKVGSVAEFLQLTPAEDALITLRLALAREIRRRRQALHLSQTEFAQRLGSSQSRVAKLEVAEPNVSLDLLVRALLATGAELPEVGRVIAAA